jgi:hypothetical protein
MMRYIFLNSIFISHHIFLKYNFIRLIIIHFYIILIIFNHLIYKKVNLINLKVLENYLFG